MRHTHRTNAWCRLVFRVVLPDSVVSSIRLSQPGISTLLLLLATPMIKSVFAAGGGSNRQESGIPFPHSSLSLRQTASLGLAVKVMPFACPLSMSPWPAFMFHPPPTSTPSIPKEQRKRPQCGLVSLIQGEAPPSARLSPLSAYGSHSPLSPHSCHILCLCFARHKIRQPQIYLSNCINY